MTYKETLFFIGKCLTISLEEKNKKEIELALKTTTIDWDSVVKVSTSHFVFPALYCNLKRVDFLHYLPADLVAYMKHITDLNRDRNQQIIAQAEDINDLLLTNKITPIFLKGTGNLLEGLYEDIAERMVGDIDFLVSKKEYKKVITVLKNDGYNVFKKEYELREKHYPRMIKKNNIAAIEVHYDMLTPKFSKFFNYEFIKNSILKTSNNISVLSYSNQILLTILSAQLNDRNYWFKKINFKNIYDFYNLSFNCYLPLIVTNFSDAKSLLKKTYYCYFKFLNIESHLLSKEENNNSSFYKKIIFFIDNIKLFRFNFNFWRYFFLMQITFKAFYKKEYFIFFISKIFPVNFYTKKAKPTL